MNGRGSQPPAIQKTAAPPTACGRSSAKDAGRFCTQKARRQGAARMDHGFPGFWFGDQPVAGGTGLAPDFRLSSGAYDALIAPRSCSDACLIARRMSPAESFLCASGCFLIFRSVCAARMLCTLFFLLSQWIPFGYHGCKSSMLTGSCSCGSLSDAALPVRPSGGMAGGIPAFVLSTCLGTAAGLCFLLSCHSLHSRI